MFLVISLAQWLFYRISGGLFNPAITIALYIAGVLSGLRAILLFITQIVGGIIASALVFGLTPGAGGNAEAAVDAVNTTLSAETTYAQGFILEMLTTSVLVFSVLMLVIGTGLVALIIMMEKKTDKDGSSTKKTSSNDDLDGGVEKLFYAVRPYLWVVSTLLITHVTNPSVTVAWVTRPNSSPPFLESL
ncbi:hypothetical protein L7F22_012025 [Adiantum nelumboides]|nr:hypothetical protein [Adiantum nelumboides]